MNGKDNRSVPVLASVMAAAAVVVVVVAVAEACLAMAGIEMDFLVALCDNGTFAAATMVVMSSVKEMTFYETASFDGQIKTRYYTMVPSRISGTLDSVDIQEGDRVEKDRTRLFVVDEVKTRQEEELARTYLVTAQSMLEESRGVLRKTEAVLEQAQKNLAWFKNLREQKIMSEESSRKAQDRVTDLRKQLKADQKIVDRCQHNVARAKTAVALAEKNRKDAVTRAPVSGVVSAVFAETGQEAFHDRPIAKIDDMVRLKAVAHLPASFHDLVFPGVTMMHIRLPIGKIGRYPVACKAPAADPVLDTFEVWSNMPGDGRYIVPGLPCTIDIAIRARRGLGVFKDAVHYMAGDYYVFVPEGKGTRMVRVEPGLENDGYVQILNSPLGIGDKVITKGQYATYS